MRSISGSSFRGHVKNIVVAVVILRMNANAQAFTCPSGFISFGTSLSDTGNVAFALPGQQASENLPYGETFFGTNAFRFSDGRLVIDFFALGFAWRQATYLQENPAHFQCTSRPAHPSPYFSSLTKVPTPISSKVTRAIEACSADWPGELCKQRHFRRSLLFQVMEDGVAARVIWFDSDHHTIAQFLDEWKPSSVPFSHVEWLTVSTQTAEKALPIVDTSGLLAAWESLCLSSLVRLTTSDIEALAIAHNVLHGKWMVFLDNDQVDAEWSKIAMAVVKNDLALDAKVSTLHVKPLKTGLPKEEKIPLGKHVICVSSANFSDTNDVFDLKARLRALGLTGCLYYKPDAYSVCGIYSGNSLGLPACKFCA